MDNGIFGLAMYGALKRDDCNYIETKKGPVALKDLVKFYEEHKDERDLKKEEELLKQSEVKSVPKKDNVKTRKRRSNIKGEIK